MKKIKLTFITIALLFVGSNLHSQFQANYTPENNDKKITKHALGLAAGFTTGYGLSYQYTHIEDFTIQLTFSPYKDETSTLISSGLTFIYRIKKGDNLNFFLYQGNHFLVDRYIDVISTFDPLTGALITTSETPVNDDRLNNGIGIGFEFFLGENVLLNLMGGYAARDNFNELGPTGEIGLFYRL